MPCCSAIDACLISYQSMIEQHWFEVVLASTRSGWLDLISIGFDAKYQVSVQRQNVRFKHSELLLIPFYSHLPSVSGSRRCF